MKTINIYTMRAILILNSTKMYPNQCRKLVLVILAVNSPATILIKNLCKINFRENQKYPSSPMLNRKSTTKHTRPRIKFIAN